jgi:formamidopyrimidine-DNA glycosylase
VPELPDIDLYVEKIDERVTQHVLAGIRIKNPFLVRSFDPPLAAAHGSRVREVRRVGKRIAFGLEPDFWLILHLMVAGRLRWHDTAVGMKSRNQLAAFDFDNGTLVLTEAGTRKRASLYLSQGKDAWQAHDPGGVEPLQCSRAEFEARLSSENRTLKRALTNPKMFSGIGNAYADEILHAARLSPIKLTSKLTPDDRRSLFQATRATLSWWCKHLRNESGSGFPEKVTAFREEMAVHGKFGKACPNCGANVQRIRYKNKETNYCPTCQTDGRILKDRSLSRLLKDGWPDSL